MAYTREDPPRICINRLLDSPDISMTTMQFLIWHEFLHVHLASGHTETFREHERHWPGYVEAERELDTLNESSACSTGELARCSGNPKGSWVGRNKLISDRPVDYDQGQHLGGGAGIRAA